jgi:hypothetical protein
MTYKPKSIVLNYRTIQRVYSTFSEWQAKQQLDLRSPEQRGICVGSSVMWRYLRNNVIITDRATVLNIAGNRLTLQIRDVQDRVAEADVHEIVNNTEDRLALSLHEIDKRADLNKSAEASLPADAVS